VSGAQTAWNAGIRPRVAPAVLLPADLAAIDCQLRSGIAPDLDTAERMVETIKSLQRMVIVRDQRAEDVAPGTVAAVVESRVPDLPESVGRRA
jgi:hypothetical protein